MRIPHSPAAVFAATVVLLLGSCSSDDPDQALLDAHHALVGAACERFAACSVVESGTDVGFVALGLGGDCEGSTFIPRYSSPEVLRRGHVVLDETQVALCVSDLGECRNPSSCTRVFLGTLPPGAACVDASECTSGACSGNLQPGACGVCGPGQARASLALGAPCTSDEACATDPGGVVVCDTALVRSTCRLRRELAEGAPCADSRDVCGAGLRCSAAGICEAPIPVGAACDYDDLCERGAVCVRPSVEPGSGTLCLAVRLLRLGDACASGDFGPVGPDVCDPSRELTCDRLTQRCVSADLPEGASCGPTLARACRSGLLCAEGVCVLPTFALNTWCDPRNCGSKECRFGPFGATCEDPLPACE